MEWNAVVQLGKASTNVEGSGQINLLDLVADAIGAAGIELNAVIVGPANEFMIGYSIGSAKNLVAMIRVTYK